MESGTEATNLTGLGLTKREVRDVLASASDAERIRLLRRSRGRMLEDLHARQQRLDRLDYYIYRLRQGQAARVSEESKVRPTGAEAPGGAE